MFLNPFRIKGLVFILKNKSDKCNILYLYMQLKEKLNSITYRLKEEDTGVYNMSITNESNLDGYCNIRSLHIIDVK